MLARDRRAQLGAPAHFAVVRIAAAQRGDRTLDAPVTRLPRLVRAPHFSLRTPAAWHAHVHDDCVALDAPGKLAEEDYTLQLCAKPGTLAQAADEQFFGQDDDGVWRRSAGMDAPSPVSWMFGPGWSAMVATQTCGVSDAETGFHAAGGTCLMFAGSDGHWALVADSEGFWQDFALGDAILRSIRFAPPPPAR